MSNKLTQRQLVLVVVIIGICVVRAASQVCLCPLILKPVCGENGKTYDNACQAACANVTVASEGACAIDCVCPFIYLPVCGEDGKTYSNECAANCSRVAVAYTGECQQAPSCASTTCPVGTSCRLQEVQCVRAPCFPVPVCVDAQGEEASGPGCMCAAIFDPVCGADGKTYSNGCVAACEGVLVEHQGECEPACICTKEYNPVCGSDNVTYSNPCMAGCVNVTIAFNGTCYEEGCTCLEIYDPVCGADGKTYGNSCLANCTGVMIVSAGECPSGNLTCGNVTCSEGQRCELQDVECVTAPCDKVPVCVPTSGGNCDTADPNSSYVSTSVEECAAIRFLCMPGYQPFFNDCGCGCKRDNE